ncbi:MAG: dihydroneopterin triphosphate diphosphatase [Acidiferrobacterales bacterium]|nr:dihydroneopterin triphosphate diphosphatase [Acidiferrobacterales bacterium]
MKPDSDRRNRRPESVLVVVHTTDNHTLLLKRTPPRSFWQSVTGSMMWGESRTETAIRELHEETGLVTKLSELRDWKRTFKFRIPPIYRHRYEEDVQLNREHVFSVLLPTPRPVVLQRSEHIEYRWVDIQTARDLVWSWSNREALEMIESAENLVSG